MKRTSKAIIFSALSLLASAANAGVSPTQYQIGTNVLACTSERAYDDQMQALAQGYSKTIQGCGVTSRPIDVIVLEMNVMSASKVRAVQNGIYLWVGIDGLEQK